MNPKRKTWIQRKPGVQGGKPCLRGTRITVETIRAVAKEWTVLQIMKAYPGAKPEAIVAALRYRDRIAERQKGPASRTVWISHSANSEAIATLAVHELIGGCQFVSTPQKAEKDRRTNGGGRIYRVDVAVTDVTPKRKGRPDASR